MPCVMIAAGECPAPRPSTAAMDLSDRTFAVEPVLDLASAALAPLLAASEAEGFRFVRRVAEEWRSGVNRFDRPGERLYGGFDSAGGLAGICGLMGDPYTAEPGVGRLRNLYVLPASRRSGLGAALTRAVIAAAGGHFGRLRLRAGTPEAARLYERLGFVRAAAEPDSTHVLALGPPRP